VDAFFSFHVLHVLHHAAQLGMSKAGLFRRGDCGGPYAEGIVTWLEAIGYTLPIMQLM
jgi:hypothetical protein